MLVLLKQPLLLFLPALLSLPILAVRKSLEHGPPLLSDLLEPALLLLLVFLFIIIFLVFLVFLILAASVAGIDLEEPHLGRETVEGVVEEGSLRRITNTIDRDLFLLPVLVHIGSESSESRGVHA